MNEAEMIELSKKHTLFSWSATGKTMPLPVSDAHGVWMHGPSGQKWLDFNSQLMSVNIGHSHPKVIARMKAACDKLLFVYPGAATEVRARFSQKLAGLFPGDLNTFFFTLGGAEANENAVRAARFFTGRQKILSRYRSYHGATGNSIQLTGDPRRWPNEPGGPGFIKVMDPTPWDYSFGKNDDEIVENNLRYLDEVIRFEGPQTIAAMFIETVTGTNGILIPPKGYLKKLKALLESYGILLVCDEVMAGWGRTGKLFAFQHDDVQPDIVTTAKGLTSSYVPLGMMAVSDKIAAHFQNNVFWGGLTYNAHPFCMEVAEAVIDVLLEEKMVENAARLEPVMRSHHEKLKAKHKSVRTFRNIGLFGLIEIQKNAKGERLVPYNGAHPAMGKLGEFLKANGLFTLLQGGTIFTNPPLCITEQELAHGFEIIDRALAITDEVFEA
ncbi:MAG: aminotransferase class III-fold pyridoxal phosphate-dependent enzyme [Archangium sp.]|nr:aminotransferase class III-fold pyridoxal phosphate-dependent enzyme [Archangium sp.]